MKDDYLWDGSGPADPAVARLESVLSQLRLKHSKAPVPRRRWIPGAAVACLLAGAALWQAMSVPPPAATAWKMEDRALVAGEVVRTGAGESRRLWADGFGQVELAPSGELSIVESRSGYHRFDLRSGTMHAFILAPPGAFVVDTPSSRAVDLGCQYTLTVDRKGNGTLDVETGWVAFLHAGMESFVPAGARCLTRRDAGPGIPFLRDAPAKLVVAARCFAETPSETAMREILDNARKEDALTVWHVMTRTEGRQREMAFERLGRLVSIPAEVTAERIGRGEDAAIDLCWNALGLESAQWWRGWRRKW
jgi:hypothetical protein